jgi:hypothetical protein
MKPVLIGVATVASLGLTGVCGSVLGAWGGERLAPVFGPGREPFALWAGGAWLGALLGAVGGAALWFPVVRGELRKPAHGQMR